MLPDGRHVLFTVADRNRPIGGTRRRWFCRSVGFGQWQNTSSSMGAATAVFSRQATSSMPWGGTLLSVPFDVAGGWKSEAVRCRYPRGCPTREHPGNQPGRCAARHFIQQRNACLCAWSSHPRAAQSPTPYTSIPKAGHRAAEASERPLRNRSGLAGPAPTPLPSARKTPGKQSSGFMTSSGTSSMRRLTVGGRDDYSNMVRGQRSAGRL